MELGLSTYTYTWAVGVPGYLPRNPLSLYQLVDKANSFRLHVIQIADNNPLHLLSDHELDSLFDYARIKDVRIEVGTRGLKPGNLMAYVSIAKRLKSGILRIVIDEPGYTPGIDEVLVILKETIPLLRRNGIKLAIENHDRFKSYEFARMVEETDPEWIGICLDSVNSMGAGEGIDEVVKMLAPYTINLHLKEFTIKRVSHKMGFVIEGLPAGQGMLNIPSLLKTIEKTGKCKSAILELWTPPDDSIEETVKKENDWAIESINYLKEFISTNT
jgi:3-oxoisoapionate decarboxylase